MPKKKRDYAVLYEYGGVLTESRGMSKSAAIKAAEKLRKVRGEKYRRIKVIKRIKSLKR